MYRSSKAIIGSAGLAVLGALILLSPTAHAQRPTASRPVGKAPTPPRSNKWVFGAHTIAAPGVTVTGPDIEGTWGTSMGAGLGLMVGYDINRAVTAFGSLDLSRQGSGVNYMTGSFGLVHAEVGIRAAITTSNPQSVPYVLGAIGRRAVGAKVTDLEDDEIYDLTLSGTMLTFGGGLQYQLSPKVALDGAAEFGIGAFNNVNDGGDVYTISVNSSTSIRLRAGVVWRP
jgi:hypothetical protein